MKCNLRTFVSRGFNHAACKRTIIWGASEIVGTGMSAISSTSAGPGARINIAFMLFTPQLSRVRSALARKSAPNGWCRHADINSRLGEREFRKGVAVFRQRVETRKSSGRYERRVDELCEVK